MFLEVARDTIAKLNDNTIKESEILIERKKPK